MSVVVNKFVELIEDAIKNYDGVYSKVDKAIKVVFEDFKIVDNWKDEIVMGIGIIN
jgi:hypothetical protein